MGVLAPEFGWEAKTGRERVRPERKDGRRDDGGVSRAEGEFSFVSDTIPTGIMRSFGAELTLRAE